MASSRNVLMLGYDRCGTCKKAEAWLKERGVSFDKRPIVDAPPTPGELGRWVPKSGASVRKWLNTSGQSYRALGREAVLAASDAELLAKLSEDGKLVRRPVLVVREGDTETAVLVGFKPEEYARTLA